MHTNTPPLQCPIDSCNFQTGLVPAQPAPCHGGGNGDCDASWPGPRHEASWSGWSWTWSWNPQTHASGICPTHLPLPRSGDFDLFSGFGFDFGFIFSTGGSIAIFHDGLFFGAFFRQRQRRIFQCLSSQLSLALHLLFLFISLFFSPIGDKTCLGCSRSRRFSCIAAAAQLASLLTPSKCKWVCCFGFV